MIPFSAIGALAKMIHSLRPDDEEKRKKNLIFRASDFANKKAEQVSTRATKTRDDVIQSFQQSAPVRAAKQAATTAYERVKTGVENDPGQLNVFTAVRRGTTGAPKIIEKPAQMLTNNPVGRFAENRIAQPVVDLPGNVRTASNKQLPLLQRGAGGLGAAAAFLPGIDDAIMAAGYDTPKAVLAGKSPIKGFTGEEYTGLGEAATLGGDGRAAQALNMAELPLILGAGSVVARKGAMTRLADVGEDLVKPEQLNKFGRVKFDQIENVFKRIPEETVSPDGFVMKRGGKLYPTEKATPEILKKSMIDLNPDGSIKEGFNYDRITFIDDILDKSKQKDTTEKPFNADRNLDLEKNIMTKAQEKGLAVRMGKVDENGAYFATPGMSTYYDAGSGQKVYDFKSAKVVASDTDDAKAVLQEALKDPSNGPEDIKRIQDSLEDGYIDYTMNDQIPSIVAAAKKKGFDGIKVWENDDVGNPSSVFLWNTKKAREVSPEELLSDGGTSVPQLQYTPATNLDAAGKAIEKKFGDFLNNNLDDAIKTYREKFGNVLNTDNARELSEDYLGNKSLYSPAVHEPSSAFTKKLYETALKEAPKPGQNNEVLFMAGGTGAGKTTAINTSPEYKNTADLSQIVYDTNLSGYASSKSKIEQALAAGKTAKILYVVREIGRAHV